MAKSLHKSKDLYGWEDCYLVNLPKCIIIYTLRMEQRKKV